MSFRLFVYYCAVCGGCAAYIGWLVGWLLVGSGTEQHLVLDMGIIGMLLGLLVALGLGIVEAMWNFSMTRLGEVVLRVGMAVAIGSLGGLVGGLLAQGLVSLSPAFRVMGWTITGLLIGAALGSFDLLGALVRSQDRRAARSKILKSLAGGAIGGLLGGILYLALVDGWTAIFVGKAFVKLCSPRAMGFVALGMCIGLAIGLAQVILKDAWIKVEKGFRAGRQLILAKSATSIGRGEGCDIGLFGDPGVQPVHAHILSDGIGFVLQDASTAGGTFVNGQRIGGQTRLRSGDVIQLGNSILVFNERARRTSGVPVG